VINDGRFSVRWARNAVATRARRHSFRTHGHSQPADSAHQGAIAYGQECNQGWSHHLHLGADYGSQRTINPPVWRTDRVKVSDSGEANRPRRARSATVAFVVRI